jgi:Protein of unknown function (DUF2852)
MSGYAANGPAYGGPGYGPHDRPWGPGPQPEAGWAPPGWHYRGPSRLFAIALTILGFMIWWPVGLVVLAFTLGRRCMRRSFFREARQQWDERGMSWKFAGWQGHCGRAQTGSGNRAFDEYRAETLRRLEEEQKDFASFLDRLRFAKDKAEFDAFVAERRRGAEPPPPEPRPA